MDGEDVGATGGTTGKYSISNYIATSILSYCLCCHAGLKVSTIMMSLIGILTILGIITN